MTSSPDSGLPVEAIVPDLRRALAATGTAVLQAEPGAGKSTIVPIRLVDDEWLGGARIVMLEPRRLATRATATRMAHLLGEDVGQTVGYRTRDEARVGRATRVEVVTEGILTRRLQSDPTLPGIGLVIFDEVHERNLQSDLALALSLDVRRGLRPDLAVLAMSATIDTGRLAALLGGTDPAGTPLPAPIVSSAGRTFPVDVRWRPREPRARLADAVAPVIREALRDEAGDVLVFLPGAAEIRWVQTALGGPALPSDVDVRPLLGALSPAEQDLALAPSLPGRRRVVLATDIAETSLTVAGVRIVVDAGLVRRPRYEGRSGLNRLHTGSASRASADQRAGRAGRTEPGVAYRIWAERDHAGREAFAPPEILDADLAGFTLELAVWGAEPSALPFLDPPPSRRSDEATELLMRLGAVDHAGRPTAEGRAMSDLPLHPRLARMVLAGASRGLGGPACELAARIEEGIGRSDAAVAATVKRRSRQLAQRLGVTAGDESRGTAALDPADLADLLAMAYPDRIAQSRGGGRYRLRSGRGVVLDDGDQLTGASFLVVAELGPGRAGQQDDRIRFAAALESSDVEAVAADDITTVDTLNWNDARDDLEQRTERRLDALILSTSVSRSVAGEATTAALVDHVRAGHLDLLRWTAAARGLQVRVVFAAHAMGGDWPDVSDEGLSMSLDEWLAPLLGRATSRADLTRIDMTTVIRGRLGHQAARDLDRVAPTAFTLDGGRSVPIDYADGTPRIATRVQDLYGTTTHPTIADGRVPLTVHLRSPAGRD
ncbi:MAG TPA: ATP-dependent helicase HrpB, partial [Acidimicrobiales bacterium]